MSIITIWFGLSTLFSLIYNYLIGNYRLAWNQSSSTDVHNGMNTPLISVLIVGRNEANNLPALLESLNAQSYPSAQLEFIYVDDHSEDQSIEVINQYALPNLKLLSLSNFIKERSETRSYKKEALSYGLQNAKGSIIVTTDADCVQGKDWIFAMTKKLRDGSADFSTGPVLFDQSDTLITQFQTLDLFGMMGVTNGGIIKKWHYLANGANMAYLKSKFETLDGYKGNEQFASGDDVFLIQKFATENPERVSFIKEEAAIVRTKTESNWKDLFWQRIRWTTKGRSYKNKVLLRVQAAVYFFHLSIVLNFIFAFLFWNFVFAIMCGLQLFLKAIIDFGYLNNVNRFFKVKGIFRTYPIQVILHTLYISIIGTLGNIMKEYEWKGRKTK